MKPSIVLPALLLLRVVTALRNPEPTMTQKLHQNKTDLTNGLELNVNISGPVNNANLPTAIGVPIQGSASVGKGEPDVSYIYIVDTSGSTNDADGDCGHVLDCVQDFFRGFHKEAVSEQGSAKLVSVINFDNKADVSASLMPPESPEIQDALSEENSLFGGTYCADALRKATDLVQHPNNTAGTTVVVFSGDGLCNNGLEVSPEVLNTTELQEAIDGLNATGAVVHTVAVGKEVDCNVSQTGEANNFLDIPRNGGECISIPGPDNHFVLIGVALKSLELQVDGGSYSNIENTFLNRSLPRWGPISVDFNTSANGLRAGNHTICIRATGEDVLGGSAQIEDCHGFFMLEEPNSATDSENSKHFGWSIFVVVIFVLGCIFLSAYGARAASRVYFCGKEKEGFTPCDVELDVASGEDGHKPHGVNSVAAGVPPVV